MSGYELRLKTEIEQNSAGYINLEVSPFLKVGWYNFIKVNSKLNASPHYLTMARFIYLNPGS